MKKSKKKTEIGYAADIVSLPIAHWDLTTCLNNFGVYPDGTMRLPPNYVLIDEIDAILLDMAQPTIDHFRSL